jgi:dephospho-CoA kinase
VHRIYEDPKTQDFLQEINTDFIQNGKVHFSTLRQAFFNEKTLKEKIEQFIYQALPQQFKHEQNQKISQGAKCIVYDVPLLLEKKLESLLDTNCLVYCSKKLQLERLIKRDQLSDDLANQMLAAQLPIDEKKEKADYIIDNSLPIDAHLNPLKDNTLKIFEKITKELKP